MMPRPAAILFDWDNTLVDAWAGVTTALNAALAAFGHPTWTEEDVRARVRVSLRDSFPGMFGDGWTRARDIFYETLAATHLDHVRPMSGIASVLDAAGAYPCAVVSNKTGPYLRAEVAHLGWAARFGAVIGAGDAAADKPDGAPLRMALDAIGIGPGETVWYVGDTALDMRAARAAGAVAVLLGDAAHDGGVAAAAPDLHMPDAATLAAALHALASGPVAATVHDAEAGCCDATHAPGAGLAREVPALRSR